MAPDFHLKDINGANYSKSDFKGKYIYLIILDNYSSNSVKILPKINEFFIKNTDKLFCIIIVNNQSLSKAEKSFSRSGYKGKILCPVDENNFISKYRLNSYPTYYLIAPDGSFILSPAPGPSASFITQFQKIYQERDIRKLRTRIKD